MDTRNAHVISFICRDDHGRSEQQLRRAIQLLFVLATNILSSLGYGPRDGNIGTQPSFNPSQQCECMLQSRTKDAADSIRPNQINPEVQTPEQKTREPSGTLPLWHVGIPILLWCDWPDRSLFQQQSSVGKSRQRAMLSVATNLSVVSVEVCQLLAWPQLVARKPPMRCVLY